VLNTDLDDPSQRFTFSVTHATRDGFEARAVDRKDSGSKNIRVVLRYRRGHPAEYH